MRSCDDKYRLLKAFYYDFQYMTPPPPDLDAQCEELKKHCKTRKQFAQQMIALAYQATDVDSLTLVCEACDWAGPCMAKTTLVWMKKFFDAAGDFTHLDESVRAIAHSRAYRILARAYEAEGRLSDALDACRSARALVNSYGNSCAVSDILVKLGKLDDALACMEECRYLFFTHKAYLGQDLSWNPQTEKQRKDRDIFLRNVYPAIDTKIEEILNLKTIGD